MKRTMGTLVLAAGLIAVASTTHAADCAGGIDATGNECNSGPSTVTTASEGDIKRLEAEQAAARIESLKASIKQREMKVAIAKATLVGAEMDLQKARDALEAEEDAQSKKKWW